tara:strand:+ start:163 stop:2514 length:2352 start_codon:yes stop_codon:yes gene_type:complete
MNILQRKMFANGDAVVQPQRNINIPELVGYYVSQGYNALDIKQMLPQLDMADIEMAVSQLGGSVNPAMASPGADEFNSPSFDVLPRIAETIVTDSPTGELSLSQAEAPQTNTGIPVGVTSPDEISAIAQRIEDLKSEKERIKNRSGFQIMNKEKIPLYLDQIDQQIASLNGELRIKLQQPSATNSSPDLNVETEASFPGLPTEQEITGSTSAIAETTEESGLESNQYRASDGIVHTIDSAKFKDFLLGLSPKDIQAMFQAPGIGYGEDLKNVLAERAAQVKTPASGFNPSSDMIGQTQLNTPITPGTTIKEMGGVLKDASIETAEELYNLGRRGLGAFDYFFKSQKEYDEKGPFEKTDFKTGRFKELDDPMNPYPNSPAGSAETMYDTLRAPGNQRRFRASSIDAGGQARFGMTAGELDNLILQSSTGVVDPIQKNINDVSNQEKNGKEVVTGDNQEGEIEGQEGEAPTSGDLASDTSGKEGGANITTGDIQNDVGGFDDDDASETSVAIYNDPDVIRLMRNLGKGIAVKGTIDEGFLIGSAGAAAEKEAEALLEKERDAKIAAEALKFGGPRKPETIKLVKEAKTNIVKQHTQFKEANSTVRLAESVKGYIENGDIQSFAARLGVGKDRLFTLAGLGPDESQVNSRERAQIALTILRQKNIKQILNEGGKNISNVDRTVAKDIAGSLDDLDLTQTPGGLIIRMQETIRSSTGKANDARAMAQGEFDALKETSQGGLYISDLNLNEEILNFLESSNLFSPNSNLQGRPSGTTGTDNVIDLIPK